MSRLRDFFSVLGIVESTEDKARKPGLIDQVIAYSKEQVRAMDPDAPFTEDKLRKVLEKVRADNLDRLLDYKVVVVFDPRLADLKSSFLSLDDTISAVLYNNEASHKILSLSDRPNIGSAVRDLVGIVLKQKDLPERLYFTTRIVGRSVTEEWENEYSVTYTVTGNPWLKEPPVRLDFPSSGNAAPGRPTLSL